MGDSRQSNRTFLRYRTLRALGFLPFVILGFRSAPPQALCFHPLSGFGKATLHTALLPCFALLTLSS